MTIETKTPAESTTNPADNVDNKQEKIINPDAVLAKNKELLAENKAFKSKLSELEGWKKQIDLEKQEQQGDFEGVKKALRDENDLLKQQLKEKDQTYAYTRFKEQFRSEAEKNGCVNSDKLFKLMTPDQLKSVEIDQGYNANTDDMTRLMESLKEEHSDIGIFGKKQVNVNPVNANFKVGNETAHEMSRDELLARIRQL